MMKKKRTLALLTTAATSLFLPIEAQEKVEADVSADIVSEYMWRGQNLGNASIQPSLSIDLCGTPPPKALTS